MADTIYCFHDIEVDGPEPGTHSMLSFACAAYDEVGNEVAAMEKNLELLQKASADPDVMNWWATHPEAWAYIRNDPKPIRQSMLEYANWIECLPGDCVFAAHPLMFDGIWIDWYLRKYAGARLFDGPFRGRNLFVGAGIDIPSFVQGALNLPYFKELPVYSNELLGNTIHSHKAIDDARGHAALYFNARDKATNGF